MIRPTTAAAILLAGLILNPLPARAADSCRTVSDELVKEAVENVLGQVVAENPGMKELGQKQLVIVAGNKLMSAPRPDFKAYGYMMLLWYGDETARQQVAAAAPTLRSQVDRAHFYFVMGLYQIGSTKPEVASQGRDYIRQMRESGRVTFIGDAMWDRLITGCRISE